MSLAHIPSHDQAEWDEAERCEAADPVETAQAAGLRYVNDNMPGIARKRVGKHFSYLDRHGKPIHDPDELQRIKALGIPPAWKQVWICPDPQGHIQATGKDAKGRKQYRYHAHWREVRDATKYDRMIPFGQTLPRIRERTSHDLSLAGLPREKIFATIVRLLDTTMIRIGNEEYVRENDSYGLTTMRNQHVNVQGSKVVFHFRGKSGKEHVIDVRDKQLAKIVKRCQELPGHVLFEYLDECGDLRTVDSSDVNDYLQEISGQDFTAKDFRTWGGTVITTRTLQELGASETQTQAKKHVVQAIKTTAQYLGNTPATCRKCYVHPSVIDAYMDGSLLRFLQQYANKKDKQVPEGLHEDEAAVLAFLQQLSH